MFALFSLVIFFSAEFVFGRIGEDVYMGKVGEKQDIVKIKV